MDTEPISWRENGAYSQDERLANTKGIDNDISGMVYLLR